MLLFFLIWQVTEVESINFIVGPIVSITLYICGKLLKAKTHIEIILIATIVKLVILQIFNLKMINVTFAKARPYKPKLY